MKISKGYVREKNNHPISFDTEGNLVDLVSGEKGTMMLPELTVTKINPKNPLYNLSKYIALYTYYPIVSRYPYTGHSRLTMTAIDKDRYRSYSINKTPRHKDYNLITNNCSNATRDALEKTFNKKSNLLLFTTPGDVQDFALKQLNGIPEIKGDSIYDCTKHKYILNKLNNKKLYNRRKVVYIPINDNLKNFLKLYIEQGHKNHLFKKGGNIILKGQLGLVTKSDNTRVFKPIILEKVPYKLKSNEFYFINKKTGKRIIGRSKLEVVSSDNRNTKLRKQDQTMAKLILKKLEADKNYNEGLKTISTLSTLAMPSTYIGPAFNNNGKSYLDNIISGEGTGNTAGNLAIDLAIPFGFRLFNKGYPYKISRGTLAIKASSKSSYTTPTGLKITPEYEIELIYPIYRDMKKSKHFKPFSEPYFEELIDNKNVTLLGLLDAGKYSEYLAERIIQNMKNQGFDPDVSSSKIIHNGLRLYGAPSRMIREKSKEPINIYITNEPTNVIGFLLSDNGKAYARIYPNATPEKIRLTTIHEGISHGTDDVVNTATDGAAADLYGRITKAVKNAGFAKTKGTERWYELRSTMAEFMAKMFKKYVRAFPGSTYADVQDAIYKEIDNMSVNKLAEEFKSLNSYGKDYGEYLMLNPFEANKFKALLKYGMGLSAPIGITNYGFKNNN